MAKESKQRFVLNLKLNTELFNDYEINSLRNKICYCRIVRKFVRGKYKYTIQLILDGFPPIKINKETGEIKNNIGLGDCGVDIGTQTIAYTSDYDCKLLELAPRIQNIENKKKITQRYIDRSKRTTNPENFNEDGTIKKGVKLKWNYSKKYNKARNKLKNLYRKQADIRKQDHNIITNKIISQCGIAKGGKYIEVNTYKIKASQYNHLNKEYNKKKLSQRWNEFEQDGRKIKVQRDLYYSYLLKNVNGLDIINNQQCINDFDKFLEMHDKEVSRLKGLNNLSSIGI